VAGAAKARRPATERLAAGSGAKGCGTAKAGRSGVPSSRRIVPEPTRGSTSETKTPRPGWLGRQVPRGRPAARVRPARPWSSISLRKAVAAKAQEQSSGTRQTIRDRRRVAHEAADGSLTPVVDESGREIAVGRRDRFSAEPGPVCPRASEKRAPRPSTGAPSSARTSPSPSDRTDPCVSDLSTDGCSREGTGPPALFGSPPDRVNLSVTLRRRDHVLTVYSLSEVEPQPPSPSTSSRAPARRTPGAAAPGVFPCPVAALVDRPFRQPWLCPKTPARLAAVLTTRRKKSARGRGRLGGAGPWGQIEPVSLIYA
jgi:hypothetical protein